LDPLSWPSWQSSQAHARTAFDECASKIVPTLHAMESFSFMEFFSFKGSVAREVDHGNNYN